MTENVVPIKPKFLEILGNMFSISAGVREGVEEGFCFKSV